MSDYDADLRTLSAELDRVEQAFRGLSESDWRRPTLLQPLAWVRAASGRAPHSDPRLPLIG